MSREDREHNPQYNHGTEEGKVSRINRVKKKPRRSSSHKRSLQKVIRETLKRFKDEMAEVRAEMADVRAENNSVKEHHEMILTGLDDHKSDNAHMREVHKHVITHNNRTLESLNLLARILTGSGTVP
ncbi:uncharacterized protein LOC120005782 [Tripterygium wilfordii]|uniref:uncharacterized protein LOC120005782 n=1 Tax=Tripterygium wilfordii TaxID=458696 RepID=UPI0018F8241F|nr:uncharacterized protein LOC120005782 [Tripterygium wilfordii]